MLLVLVALAIVLTLLAILASAWNVAGRRFRADARGDYLRASGPPVTSYPWARETSGADSWGFRRGQCTSYVAWWLNSHGVSFARFTRGPAGTGHFADATNWDAAAREAGFPVRTAPLVGSVAQWRAGETSRAGGPRTTSITAGCNGHVAIVLAVERDGSVWIAGYDGTRHAFDAEHTRAPRYLYLGLPKVLGPIPSPPVGCSTYQRVCRGGLGEVHAFRTMPDVDRVAVTGRRGRR